MLRNSPYLPAGGFYFLFFSFLCQALFLTNYILLSGKVKPIEMLGLRFEPEYYQANRMHLNTLARVYTFLGNQKKALDNLEKAFERRAFAMPWIKAEPGFNSLRDEPRYQEILRKMNLTT